MKKYLIPTTIATLILASLSIYLLINKTYQKENNQNNLTTYTDNQTITLYYNQDQKLELTVARSDQAQSKGLMYIDKPLEKNQGMIFIYENEKPLTFWMKNTLIPLDIIFLDENLEIINIHENTKINQIEEVYSSSKPAQYVIEVNAGWSKENNINKGDSFNIK